MKDATESEGMANLFVYDGCCLICFKATLIIKKFNPKMVTRTSQEIYDEQFYGIKRKDFHQYAFYVDEDKLIHKGYFAILESLSLKKSKYHFAYLVLNSGLISFIGTIIYGTFSRFRYRFKCGENCKNLNMNP